MRYLKFYIGIESLKNLRGDIKDVRFTESNVSADGKTIEVTCLVECNNTSIGEDNSRDCCRYKLKLTQ